MATDELAGADQFLFNQLSSSSSLAALVGDRIYNADTVPQAAQVPAGTPQGTLAQRPAAAAAGAYYYATDVAGGTLYRYSGTAWVAQALGGLPYVSFGFTGGSDIRVIGGRRIMTNTRYRILARTRSGSYAQAQAIVQAFDAVLEGVIGVQIGSDIYIQGCYRIMPVRYPEVAEGVRYLHYGGDYRCLVDALT